MSALLASDSVLHHALEQRAKNGWRDFGPLKVTAEKQRVAHCACEAREPESLLEEATIDETESVKWVRVGQCFVSGGVVKPVE